MSKHTKENFIADFYSEDKKIKVGFSNDKYHYVCRISKLIHGGYVEQKVILHDLNDECGIPQILKQIFDEMCD